MWEEEAHTLIKGTPQTAVQSRGLEGEKTIKKHGESRYLGGAHHGGGMSRKVNLLIASGLRPCRVWSRTTTFLVGNGMIYSCNTRQTRLSEEEESNQ